MSADRALADPVLVDELVPLWVVRLIEAAGSIDWELYRAPSLVAERMRSLLAQVADGAGPVADFAYSSVFASHVDRAREQIAAGELDAAWDTRPLRTPHLDADVPQPPCPAGPVLQQGATETAHTATAACRPTPGWQPSHGGNFQVDPTAVNATDHHIGEPTGPTQVVLRAHACRAYHALSRARIATRIDRTSA